MSRSVMRLVDSWTIRCSAVSRKSMGSVPGRVRSEFPRDDCEKALSACQFAGDGSGGAGWVEHQRNPAEDPTTVEGNLGRALGLRAARSTYSPLNWAFRFSRNAEMPSCLSAVP